MVLSLASAAVAWARIAGLDPSSAMIAPRYLNLLTQSSFSPLTLMSVLKPLVLFVISLVFSALICMPKAVEVLSRRSTKSASSSSLPARPSMSSARRKFVIFLPPMLSYSDGGSEPVPYAVVEVDCAGGLLIEVLYHSDRVGVDVEMPHGGP